MKTVFSWRITVCFLHSAGYYCGVGLFQAGRLVWLDGEREGGEQEISDRLSL